MITSQNENISPLQRKIPFIILIILATIIIIGARIFYLQILKGDDYIKISTEILIRSKEIRAERGKIFDRNGKIIADSQSFLEITLTPQHSKNPLFALEELSRLLPLDRNELLTNYRKKMGQPGFEPIVLFEKVPYDWAVKIKENLYPQYDENSPFYFEGLDLIVTPIRRYLYPELFAHALGYLTEIDQKKLDELKAEHPDKYSRGDLLGAAGIEAAYDFDLRGLDGQLGRVVDARGHEIVGIEDLNVIRENATVMPQKGYDLLTTLDFDAQLAASEFFKEKKGAVVAMDPRNGEILVFLSSPGFDANRITKKIEKEYWQKINLDEDRYLFNRAIQAQYPPASTYKVIGAIAALEMGMVDPEKTKFTCRGGLNFGNRFFKCWKSGGHGTLSLVQGLGQSCDVFFYNVGMKVGVDGLAKYAQLLGFGHETGIEIPFEKPGLIPTKAWKKKVRHEEWYDSETLSVVIGQSFDLITILQNAKVAATIANGGYNVKPHLGQAILGNDKQIIRQISFPKEKTELTGHESLKWAMKGMIEVVQGYGTATRLRVSPFKIAGKTGTAQVVSHGKQAKKGANVDSHALFIGIAPYDDPQIVVSVMMEHGKGGSFAAAPVAMKVIDTYLMKKELKKYLYWK